jgi:hypothetical protein
LQDVLIKSFAINANCISYPIVLEANQAEARKGHEYYDKNNRTFGH